MPLGWAQDQSKITLGWLQNCRHQVLIVVLRARGGGMMQWRLKIRMTATRNCGGASAFELLHARHSST